MSQDLPLIGMTVCRRNVDVDGEVFSLSPDYARAVIGAGGAPILLPLGVGEATLRDLYERLDGVLLSGGGDVDPNIYGGGTHVTLKHVDSDRDRIEGLLTQWAVEDDKPLLAICRGIQMLNVALGGSLIRDIPSQVPGALKHDCWPDHPTDYLAHTVEVRSGSALQAALETDGTLPVNSLHHQAIQELAPSLEVTAHAPDGIIEGVELPERRFVLGVQWHPEILTPTHAPMRRLFRAYIEAASG